MNNFFKNYFSTLFFIFIWYFFYTNIPFYQDLLIRDFSFPFWSQKINSLYIFQVIIGFYIILLIPFYTSSNHISKARRIIQYLIHKVKNFKYKITSIEKISLLSWGVKLFFAPLMIFWFSDHLITIINKGYLSYNDFYLFKEDFLLYFNKHLFFTCLMFLFFVDVFFFTFGYLLETQKFKNTIKSVDATFFGWLVTLICYPPFNTYVTKVIGWYPTDFPQFPQPYIHISINILLLFLVGLYASASISLGLKASNLTNRGIITSGLYKYIRHPAYTCKNIFWWIGASPLLIGNILNHDIKNTLIVLSGLIGWSIIYYFRAITEERHLSLDPEYVKYKQKVIYKFIPGII